MARLRFTLANRKGAVAGKQRKKTVQSLQRGLEILAAVAQAERSVGITELSRQFALAKGSISRLVATLEQQSFLTRDPETNRYRASVKLWQLGSAAISRLHVREIARPVMEELNTATQETVHLTVLTEGNEMVFLEKLDSTRGVRPNVQLGAPHPPYCVANGKAMLAFLPEARIAKVLHDKLRKFTNTTITRESELRAHLETVRRLGYAVNRGEYRADVSGLAAPICDHTGVAVAALGISMPANRMTSKLISDLAPRLVKGARRISLALGHRGERTIADQPAGPLDPTRPGRSGVRAPTLAGGGRAVRQNRAAL